MNFLNFSYRPSREKTGKHERCFTQISGLCHNHGRLLLQFKLLPDLIKSSKVVKSLNNLLQMK